MHIAMIGSGYVGLVSGACLADFGHNVTCVDKDQDKIAALNRGAVPIFEPGLDDLIANNTRERAPRLYVGCHRRGGGGGRGFHRSRHTVAPR